jgi:hypothetical protein
VLHGSPNHCAHVGQKSVVVELVLLVEVVVVVMAIQTLLVHASPVGQSPQFRITGQLPSLMRPHWPGAHVVGVQQIPASRLPGGLLLTHALPQQL